jgi:hypothetical protein
LVTLLKLFERKVCYEHLLSKEEIEGFGVNALDILDVEIKMDGVIVAVAHDEFGMMKLEDLIGKMNSKPVLSDLMGDI